MNPRASYPDSRPAARVEGTNPWVGSISAESGRFADSWVLLALIVTALTVIGAVVRLVMLRDSLFADELSTYWIVSGRSLGGVVSTVHTDAEITPPLFFAVAWLTARIALTAEMLRLPSFIAGVAAIPLVYLLGVRTVGRWAGTVGAALTALSPFMIFFSTEARGYELMIVLVLCSTLALLAGVKEGRTRWWIIYAVTSCGAVYTHYTAVFALAVQFLWLLWAHPEARRAGLLANLVAVLGFLPWITGLIADLQSPTTKILAALEPLSVHTVLTSLSRWSLGYPFTKIRLSSLPGVPALALIAGGAAIAIIGGLVAGRDRRRSRQPLDPRLVLIVGLALAAPIGEVFVSAVGTDVLGIRNLAVSWPAFALVVATVLVAVPMPLRIVPVALVLAGFAIAAVKMAQPGYQRPGARKAADFISHDASPGDVVMDAIQLSPGPRIALDLYLDRPLKVFRLGQPQERDHPFGLFDPILTPAEVVRRAAAAADGRRIFLVTPTEGGPYRPTPLGAAAVRNLPARYRRVQAQSYAGFVPLATLVFAKKHHAAKASRRGAG
jgi:mannosyltransferase